MDSSTYSSCYFGPVSNMPIKNCNRYKMILIVNGPVVQWLRYFACTEETRVQFTAGPFVKKVHDQKK